MRDAAVMKRVFHNCATFFPCLSPYLRPKLSDIIMVLTMYKFPEVVRKPIDSSNFSRQNFEVESISKIVSGKRSYQISVIKQWFPFYTTKFFCAL